MITCVFTLDGHPTNTQQSETTFQQEQTVKESQDNVEQKGTILINHQTERNTNYIPRDQ